jgi:hypothetical protein
MKPFLVILLDLSSQKTLISQPFFLAAAIGPDFRRDLKTLRDGATVAARERDALRRRYSAAFARY